jgi:hypothetical protein
MFLQEPTSGQSERVWVLEWYLSKTDIRRLYLKQVAEILYGSEYANDETQCMIMLTHALANLRRLKITIQGDQILGELDDGQETGPPETVMVHSLEDPELEESGDIGSDIDDGDIGSDIDASVDSVGSK